MLLKVSCEGTCTRLSFKTSLSSFSVCTENAKLTITLSFHVELEHLFEKQTLVPPHTHTQTHETHICENLSVSDNILWIIVTSLTASYPLKSDFLSGLWWIFHIARTYFSFASIFASVTQFSLPYARVGNVIANTILVYAFDFCPVLVIYITMYKLK